MPSNAPLLRLPKEKVSESFAWSTAMATLALSDLLCFLFTAREDHGEDKVSGEPWISHA